MKEEQIEIEKDLKKLRESLQVCKQELGKKQNELSQANQEEMDKKKEKTKVLEKNKSEEDDLKKKMELAKKKLASHHGEKDRYDVLFNFFEIAIYAHPCDWSASKNLIPALDEMNIFSFSSHPFLQA